MSRLIEHCKNALTKVSQPIGDDELQATAEEVTNSRRPVSIGVGILGAALLVFVLWASLAPLDEGVPAPGLITVESKRKMVQHLTGGIIKKILVKEAQEVHAGDPLIELDDTTPRANFDAARQQYYALQAQADRLHAEVIRANKIEFSPDLLKAADDPFARESMINQQKLFATRRQALQGEITILTASVQSAEEQIRALEAQARGKGEQLKFVREQLAGSRELAKEGYLPRNRWYEEERLASDLQASVNELQASTLRARSMHIEAQQRLAQRQRDFQKEVETQYSDTRREAATTAERLRSTREEFARMTVRAPVDGIVNGLSQLTEGSVVSPAVRLMDIVPKDEALIIEAKVEPNFIDRVHTGLPVDISLHAFANDPSLVVAGKLESISADLVFDSTPGQPAHPYYLARVRVTPEGLQRLGNRVLQPGMPAQVTIKTGERTLIHYLMKPLFLRFATSMKEY